MDGEIGKQIISTWVNSNILRCFKVYGIEGTLEVIERAYNLMPTIKEEYLKEYRKILSHGVDKT